MKKIIVLVLLMITLHAYAQSNLVQDMNNYLSGISFAKTRPHSYLVAEDSRIRQFAMHHALVFFYDDMPASRRFAPIVKAFAQNYGFYVVAITSGVTGFVPEFPHSRLEFGEESSLNINLSPVLITVDPVLKKIKWVAIGDQNRASLKEKMLQAIDDFDKAGVFPGKTP